MSSRRIQGILSATNCSILFSSLCNAFTSRRSGTISSSSSYQRESLEFGRGLSFFDAIYGFAITLLIANIDMPPASAWDNLSTLFDNGVGTQLLGFVISFVVIVVFWRKNVDLVSRLTGMDSAVMTANIITTGLIVFIPFTTQGISDSATSDLPLPTALYAVNISLAILTQMAMFEIAYRHGLVRDHLPRVARVANIASALVTPAVFLASIPVAYLIDAGVAKYVWLSLIVIGPAFGRYFERYIKQPQPDADQASSTSE